MEQSTPYELLIAQKLEHAPLPELADSIWASIEVQLDIPLPGDSHTEPPAQNPPGKGLPGMGKLLYIAVPAVIIVAAWYYLKNKKEKKTEQISPVAPVPSNTGTIDSSNYFTIPDEKKNIPAPQKNDTSNRINPGNVLQPVITFDTGQQFQPPSVIPDTAAGEKGIPVVTTKDTASLIPRGKKPKGVKGIKDSDYKIITEKKDTAKKGR